MIDSAIFTITFRHIIAVLWLLASLLFLSVKNENGYYDYTMNVINGIFGFLLGCGFILILMVNP